MAEYKKGDIVKNRYAGEENPYRYLVYLGKGTIRQGRHRSKSYDCLGFDGKKAQFFRNEEQFELVGHMTEFDLFMSALGRLRTMTEEKCWQRLKHARFAGVKRILKSCGA